MWMYGYAGSFAEKQTVLEPRDFFVQMSPIEFFLFLI